MTYRKNYHNHVVLDIINAAGMDETYGTYVDDECFDIHDYDDVTDHDADDNSDDDTDADPNEVTEGGRRGNLCRIKGFGGWVGGGSPWGGSRLGGSRRATATHPRPTWMEMETTETETETTETTETNSSTPGTPQTNAPRDHICRLGHRQAPTHLTLIFSISILKRPGGLMPPT